MSRSKKRRKAALLDVPPKEFERLVEEALTALPGPFKMRLNNVAVIVEEEPNPEDVEAVGLDSEEELFGLYQGLSLLERGTDYSALPDRVLIYRGPILRWCRNRKEVVKEVRDTLVHELGHHFGMEEDELPY